MPLDKVWASAGSAQAPWLYDLEADPQESYNLKTNYPEVIRELQGKFQECDDAMQKNPGGWKSVNSE